MNFGTALELAKKGKRIARKGWNGKDMFVFTKKGSISESCEISPLVNGVRSSHFEIGDFDTVISMPCFCLKAADGSIVTGWLASQTDMFAEDWKEVK
ncbi:DUF2829 domain-containing protein [Rhodobacteraceae bacterium R_SAG4]|nr:DUF2829 domain-containing protein [Rhodobacteraceae bacterium R_SAG4]